MRTKKAFAEKVVLKKAKPSFCELWGSLGISNIGINQYPFNIAGIQSVKKNVAGTEMRTRQGQQARVPYMLGYVMDFVLKESYWNNTFIFYYIYITFQNCKVKIM